MVGSPQETNAALLIRCEAKLGALSPNGPSQAYYYIATTATTPSGTPINRANVTQNLVTGVVTVYIANSNGAPSTPDADAINAAIQAQVVPSGITAIVAGATSLNIAITSGVWVPTATGLTTLAVQNAATAALATYFSNLPIGGILDPHSGIFVVPVEEITATIYEAVVALAPGFASRIAVVTTAPTADTLISANQVAVGTPVTIGVNFT
jgi:hypothetical protein